MACVQECPAFIDIVDTIIDLRRYLTLSEGALPSTAPQSLQNIQRAGNPWGLPAGERLAWARGLEVPVMEVGREVEYLYWVGCSASYDRRNQAIARAVVKILRTAGVSFGVMAEERCHAEVGRRLGEEYLYQTVQQENVEAIKRYRFGKVLTHCPHCFNTLKHEYPRFEGGKFQVVHHSELIADLIRAGRVTAAGIHEGAVAFHDPCYLGRYNGILDAPRAVIAHASGAAPLEFPYRGERSMCCGAGGGRMWMDEDAGSRINVKRVRQVLERRPRVIATACPYCKTMMADGIAQLGRAEETEARDIAELVAAGLEKTGEER
jgi:Fe-S oxidoreductase